MTTHTSTAQPELADRVPRSRAPLADELLAENSRSVHAAAVRLIVAFDGSPASNDALALSARLARSPGSNLLVVCAFPFESLASIPFESRADRIASGDHRIFVRQDADAVLAEARATLPDDLDVTFRALGCESPLQGLRQLALSEMADVLVLGSTHRGRLGRLLHPSLARRVLRDPPCLRHRGATQPSQSSQVAVRPAWTLGSRPAMGARHAHRYIRGLQRAGV